MKKNIKKFLCACLAIFAGFIVVGCNLQAQHEVTKEQWSTALNANGKFVITVENTDVNEANSTIYVNGYMVKIEKTLNNKTETLYMNFDGTNYWGYSYKEEISLNVWARTNITEEIYKKFKYEYSIEDLPFDKFIYFSETKTYEANDLVWGSSLKDITMKFNNLKISEIIISDSNTTTLSFDYSTQFTITLPQFDEGNIDPEGWT